MTDTTHDPDPVPQDDDTAWPDTVRPTDDPQSPDDPGEKRRDRGGNPVDGVVQTPPD